METLAHFETLILTLHFIVCIFLVIVILIQAGKGADIGATLGGGSSQTLFGARGASTFLSKITTIAAILFLLTSGSLAAIHKNRTVGSDSDSIIEKSDVKPAQEPVKEPVQIPNSSSN